VHRLRRDAAAEARRLLRVLLLRVGAMPADSSRAFGRDRRGLLLRGVGHRARRRRCKHARLVAQAAHKPVSLVNSAGRNRRQPRYPIIGASCSVGRRAYLDGQRVHPQCNALWRTHCRYSGPYYLAMVVPVFLLAAGTVSAGFSGWLMLAVVILAGSKIIWWATERALGTFS
jgi:hypothetical protein